jgi:hypothetical protein
MRKILELSFGCSVSRNKKSERGYAGAYGVVWRSLRFGESLESGGRIFFCLCVYQDALNIFFAFNSLYNNTGLDHPISGVDSVRFISAQRIKFLGHVQRLDVSIAKRIFEWKPMGR